MKLQVSDTQLRNRILREISAFEYGSWSDLAREYVVDFERSLSEKEQAILDELVAAKKVGIGLGMGPGGGQYQYVMLDKITPEFVQDIISQSEGRALYHLEPQCGTEAGQLFLAVWKKAVADGLKRGLFYRHYHRYYTDRALYLQAKADSEARKRARVRPLSLQQST